MNTNKDWLDIASAPKDGTPVLLFARHIDAEASTRVVGWFNADYGWIAQSYAGQSIARLVPSLWAELMPFPGSPASTVATEGEKDERAFDAKLGAYIREWLRRHGWHPEDGEGEWEFAQRICYEAGRRDAAPYWARTYEDQDNYDQAVADAIKRVSARIERAGRPAAGDARAEAVPDWMACESRRPWVTNGLKAYAQELRDKERRCRTAYNKDFYGIPARYIADACADAAAVFEAKLAAIAQQSQRKEA